MLKITQFTVHKGPAARVSEPLNVLRQTFSQYGVEEGQNTVGIRPSASLEEIYVVVYPEGGDSVIVRECQFPTLGDMIFRNKGYLHENERQWFEEIWHQCCVREKAEAALKGLLEEGPALL